MRTIETHSRLVFDDGMACKLSSIIWCEGLLIFFWKYDISEGVSGGCVHRRIYRSLEHTLESITNILGSFLFSMSREDKSTHTIYGSNNSMTSRPRRNNGVYLPVSEFSSSTQNAKERMMYFSLFDYNLILYLVFLFSCFHLFWYYFPLRRRWQMISG